MGRDPGYAVPKRIQEDVAALDEVYLASDGMTAATERWERALRAAHATGCRIEEIADAAGVSAVKVRKVVKS